MTPPVHFGQIRVGYFVAWAAKVPRWLRSAAGMAVRRRNKLEIIGLQLRLGISF